jgi:D-glucosaminate-6-phosphate ammonia-lyase
LKVKMSVNFFTENNLRHIVNVSGTMTGLGSCIVPQAVIDDVANALPFFVEMNDLQRLASTVISDLCGAEAGFVTASCAAGITLSVAAAMTGCNIGHIERLPDAAGLKNEVLIQTGHLVHYGAPIDQSIRLAGAKVVQVGQSTYATRHQLDYLITTNTAAAIYVVSHHAVSYGQIPLSEFIAVCHAKNIPVIVDAASEYDLKIFLNAGADIALYSTHKFLSGLTGGIVAGKKEFVKATFMQNLGIGRGMKVGKEGIVGAISALKLWKQRNHKSIFDIEQKSLYLWLETLSQHAGINLAVEKDPTNNPLNRLRVEIDADVAGFTARALRNALAEGQQAVIVRDHEIEHGYFYMDPCNLHEQDSEIVALRLRQELINLKNKEYFEKLNVASADKLSAYLNWLT